MDCEAEKRVRPPMIADERMEGDLILSAGGINYIAQGMFEPRPIPVEGNYQIGVDRYKMRQDMIRAKFHAQLFNMFEGLDGIRTATEINERAAEKITTITPAFSRIANEKHTPMLQALFAMWLENGMLPTPPQEAIQPVSDTMGFVPAPVVTFSSRLALAIKTCETSRRIATFSASSRLHRCGPKCSNPSIGSNGREAVPKTPASQVNTCYPRKSSSRTCRPRHRLPLRLLKCR